MREALYEDLQNLNFLVLSSVSISFLLKRASLKLLYWLIYMCVCVCVCVCVWNQRATAGQLVLVSELCS